MDGYRYETESEVDEDEQLRIAIALSLEDQKILAALEPEPDMAPTTESTVQEHDKGPQASISSASQMVSQESDKQSSSTDVSSEKPLTSQTSKSNTARFLGLDRKSMERERLARKRKARSPSPLTNSDENEAVETSSKRSRLVNGFAPASKKQLRLPDITLLSPSQPRKSRLRFPAGAVLKTWAYGHERENDIKIEEVLERSDLELAVLSAFQMDVAWVVDKLNMAKTKLFLVMQAKEEATRKEYQEEISDAPNVRLCFPPMPGNVNCMHSKLMLLSHPTYLRIAVPSANLVDYDWGETGVMENSVFIIDLPRLPKGGTTKDEDMTNFGKSLLYFCNAMTLPTQIVESLRKFDFAATKDIAFVHSIGGEHTGPDEPWRMTGYCGLGKAIKELGLQTDEPLKLDFIASSIGAAYMELFTMLYLAAQGDDGSKEYNWRTNVPRGKKSKGPKNPYSAEQAELLESIPKNLNLYFPSHETVRESKGGINAGGTVCFQRQWWESPKFPRQILRDFKSARKGLLMHNKILFVQPASTSSSARAWAYIGSANCSESAWGKLVKSSTTKQPKLNCRNWECGVVLPMPASPETLPETLDRFKSLIPIPIQYPGEPYTSSRRPWFFMDREE